MADPKPVFLALTRDGLVLARRLQADALPDSQVHGLSGRADGADLVFADTMAHVRGLFAEGRPIIGLCATGILIRAIAPLLVDKTDEPPVLAVAATGEAVVPLVGGHRGANALARHLAAELGIVPALTTAGDGVFGLALDAPPPGWRVANPRAAKGPMAALLAGEALTIHRHAPSGDWPVGLPETIGAEPHVLITDRPAPPQGGGVADAGAGPLVIHPPVLALGVGCARDCAPSELADLALETLAEAGLSPLAVACVVSVDVKSDELAVHALAGRLGVPARFYAPDVLERETPRLANPSDVVFAEVGCHGVAEGAALAAVGPDGALIQTKRKTANATCAIARGIAPLDPGQLGRPRGRLHIVGIGPGAADHRTPAASAALAESSDLVGYGLYLDLLGPAASGKARHDTGLGHETERARQALVLAAEGRVVSLVCSGDAGIYALATLVFELLEREGPAYPSWGRVAIDVTPGISALQMAAARAGALLNHDFCAISLSNLLTPWDTIERRVRAAAQGDFVVAFYNPVSQRRRDQLPAARALLLEHRPAESPVVLARNLGRADETVRVTTLGALSVDDVDMLTVVLVGSSQSRRVGPWAYTPRGYAAKETGPGAETRTKTEDLFQ